MSALGNNPILDPLTRFISMGIGLACVGSVIPKAIVAILDTLKLPTGFVTEHFVTLAIVFLIAGFVGGGILGLKLDPDK